MRFILQLVAVAAIAFAGGQAVAAVQGNDWLTLAGGLVAAALALLVYAWIVRRTEKREVTELARSGAAGGLTRGVLIGLAMFGAVIANIWFLGDFHVGGIGSVSGAVGILGFMAAAATTEELLFRGVLFRWIEKLTGTWIALLVSGVVFGGVHLLNPDATLWGATAIAIEAGFMLATCYAATRSLWVTIGLHFGWNFALGGIFSAVVSGNGDSKGLLDTTLTGPDLITGGSFGPEGSVYTVAAGVILTVVFLWLAARRGNIVAPRGRRTRVSPATVTVSR
ncbi:CPBP family intramembrane glutamic endopeptidase [Actinoplanes sp. NBRC 103695]|uniref:CPBP family intramembrane glutamic endopeptidase n=1 Tax=Actinoplanes sp. NBRC 103695 TaxID=3032202 RepID=UPI0024A5A67D|nr:CPBP family intramembrane glutamic endopeptidase [Actinoplanes sp. NBRC 103695]GLY98579.1 CAAX amino protease [Actinoplanes sp. NBRC 103695]